MALQHGDIIVYDTTRGRVVTTTVHRHELALGAVIVIPGVHRDGRLVNRVAGVEPDQPDRPGWLFVRDLDLGSQGEVEYVNRRVGPDLFHQVIEADPADPELCEMVGRA